MKYVESLFDVCYLLFVFVMGGFLYRKGSEEKMRGVRLMGWASILLGLGDSCHLIPRCIQYFVDSDLSFYLGFGKLITSITMTIFYVILFEILKEIDCNKIGRFSSFSIYLLAGIRILLCLFPQNEWFLDNSPYLWGILRNIPFFFLGGYMVFLFFQYREVESFGNIWLFIFLSFLFYAIVVLGCDFLPILGMFMIPKTVCYVLMIGEFYRYSKKC